MFDKEYRFDDFDPPIPFLTGDASALHSILTEINRVYGLDPEAVKTRQSRYLLTLMSFFSKASPEFRNRLSGEIPKGESSLSDLLSLVKPEDKFYFQKLPHNVKKVPRHHLPTRVAKTSGSTGMPLRVHCTAITRSIGMAQILWSHLASGTDFSWKMASVKPTNHGVKLSTSWDPATSLLFKVGPMLSLSTSIGVLAQLDHLEEYQPDILIVLPSVLKEYLSLWGRGLRDPLKLKVIRTMGETLPEETRVLSQQITGASVLDTYSSSEVERIATQVSPHAPYTINNYSLIVEILRENGERCLPGEAGRVVVTDLFNYATPLIRYDIGDWAVPDDPHHHKIREVKGRSRNMVTLPDGRKVWPLTGYREFSEVIPVRQFHIQQVSLFLLKAQFYVDRLPNQDQREKVRSIIRENMGYNFEIKATYQTEPLEKKPNGKLEDFVSLV